MFEDKLQMAKKFRNLCECTDNAEQIIKSNADDKDSSLLALLSEIRQIIEN